MTDDKRDGAPPVLHPHAPHPSASQPEAAPYRVLARKYRPKTFDELIGQDVMARILTNAFDTGRIHQAYMLTGVRGVGKTTTARILSRALNYELPSIDGAPAVARPTIRMPELGLHCQAIIDSRHVDVIEMDAASHTGVDDIREIIEGARYKPAVARMKVYIIDEVHMLSKSAFNALLKTLEEPPEHVKFIFATTEIDRVPITVRSRCLRFDLRRVETPVLAAHLARVCGLENVRIEEDALHLIARAAEGSVRDALSLLDQAIANGGEGAISAAQTQIMLGLADKTRIIALFEAVMAGEIAGAIALLQAQYDDGADPAQILLELAEFTHLAMRMKIAPDAPFTASHPDEAAAAKRNAETLSVPILNRAWQILMKGIAETRESPRALAAADMVLARLAYAADLPTPDEALRKMGFGQAKTSPSPLPAASRASPTHGNARLALAAAPLSPESPPSPIERPQTAPIPALLNLPPASSAFQNFADVVAKAAQERDIQLKIMLERDVRLIRFEPGRMEFSLAPGGSPQLAQTLMCRLQEWSSGERWIVAISREDGAPSIMETREAEARERERGIAADPLVRAALNAFPGAEIIAVRTPAGASEALAPPPHARGSEMDDVLFADEVETDGAEIDPDFE